MHGLCFTWFNYLDVAFEATIFDHGEKKATIIWEDDWEEFASRNKEMILMNNGLSIFKP